MSQKPDKHSPLLTALLALLVIFQFCQVWPQVAGYTVRAETVLTLVLLFFVLMHGVIKKSFGSLKLPLTWPLLVWISVLMFGMTYTLVQSVSPEVKKNAIVNSIRLALSFATFFVVLRYPLPPRKKLKIISVSILGFSLLTSVIAVAQIAYHDGWFSISLPRILIEKAIDANIGKGREIFGLNISDTQAHSFAGFVAIQAACAFYILGRDKDVKKKCLGIAYTAILLLIVVRVSVRAALIGFIFGLILVSFQSGSRHTRKVFRLVMISCFWLILILSGLKLLEHYSPTSYYLRRIFAIVPQFQYGELFLKGDSSIYGRIWYWKGALEAFRQSPFIGVGFYTFSVNVTPFTNVPVSHAHNGYLHTLAEFGLIGASSLFFLMRGGLRTWQMLSAYQTKDFLFLALRYFLLWAFGYLLFTAIFSNTFFQPQYIGSIFIIFGALVDYVQRISVKDRQDD